MTRAPGRRLAALTAVAAWLILAAPAHALSSISSEPSTATAAGTADADFSTPQRTAAYLLAHLDAGEYSEAAAVFAPRRTRSRASLQDDELARQLKTVLDRKLYVDVDSISDDPAGDAADGAAVEIVGEIPLEAGEGNAAISLVSLTGPSGRTEWRVAPETLAAVPRLHALYGPSWAERAMPAFLTAPLVLGLAPWQWLGLVATLVVAWMLAYALTALLRRTVTAITRRTRAGWDDRLIPLLAKPTRIIVGLLVLEASMHALALPARHYDAFQDGWRVLLIGALVLFAIRLVDFFGSIIEQRATQGTGLDDLSRRGARTQVVVLRRVAHVVAVVLGAALVLVQFEVLRAVGVSLLASAGVAGIVMGLAAQRSISSLLAGIQLSITQPIRIGDSVIVEGEYGTIEEITLTYVVVRVWDLRRLIVPMNRFLEEPFQNWTKMSPRLLGTVMVYADFAVPIDDLRREQERFVRAHPLWDEQVNALQVTDWKHDVVEIRILVSAVNSGNLFDLRCAVREHVLGYLASLEGGRYLPRRRLEPALEVAGGANGGDGEAAGSGGPLHG